MDGQKIRHKYGKGEPGPLGRYDEFCKFVWLPFEKYGTMAEIKEIGSNYKKGDVMAFSASYYGVEIYPYTL